MKAREMDRPHWRLTRTIIDAAHEVYRELGKGLREVHYVRALAEALTSNGLKVTREKRFTLRYGEALVGYVRADLDVDESVIVEVKAVRGGIGQAPFEQALSTLKASGRPVGLLVSFHGDRPSVKRLINTEDSRHSQPRARDCS